MEEKWESPDELYRNHSGQYVATIGGENWKVDQLEKNEQGKYRLIRGARHFDEPEEQKTYDEASQLAKKLSTGQKIGARGLREAFSLVRGIRQAYTSGEKGEELEKRYRKGRILDKALEDEMGWKSSLAANVVGSIADPVTAPALFMKTPATALKAAFQGARVGSLQGGLGEKEEGESRLKKAGVQALETGGFFGVLSKGANALTRAVGPTVAKALGREEYKPPKAMPWLVEDKIPPNIRDTSWGRRIMAETIPEEGMARDAIEKSRTIPEQDTKFVGPHERDPFAVEKPGRFFVKPKEYLERWLPDAMFRTQNAHEINKLRGWKMANYWSGKTEELGAKLNIPKDEVNDMLRHRLEQDETGALAGRYGEHHNLQPVTLPKELEDFYQKEHKPLIQDMARIVLSLKKKGTVLPEEIKEFAEGYFPHAPIERTPWYQTFKEGGAVPESRFSGSESVRQFKTSDPSMKSQKIKAIESTSLDPNVPAERHIIHEAGGKISVYREGALEPFGKLHDATPEALEAGGLSPHELDGRKVVDGQGRIWKIVNATLDEKEAATNQRYIKDTSTLLTMKWLALKRVENETRFVDLFKETPEFMALSVAKSRQPLGAPPGMSATKLWNFHDRYFDTRIAEILDNFAGRTEGGMLSAAQAANNFLVRSIFWNPQPHDMNILSHWINQRGLTSWIFPKDYMELSRSLPEAIKSVMVQDETYLTFMREGGATMANRIFNKEMQDHLVRMSGDILKKDPAFKEFAKEVGYKNHAEFIKAWYANASKGLWIPSDVMALQAVMEYMKKYKVPMREAIYQVERHLPNYRVDARMFGTTSTGQWGRAGRIASQAMTTSWLSSFGRYHYGVVRSYSATVQDTAAMLKGLSKFKKPTGQQAHSMDQLAMMMVQLGVMYPLYSNWWKEVTGNDHADVARFGAERLPHSIYEVAKGERPAAWTMTEMFTPSPVAKFGIEMMSGGKSMMTGQPIANPSDIKEAPLLFGKDVGGYLASQVAPFQSAGRLYGEKDTPGQILLRQIGVKSPTEKQVSVGEKAKHSEEKRDIKRRGKEYDKLPEWMRPSEKEEAAGEEWEVPEELERNEAGQYRALKDGEWVKVRELVKSSEGRYMFKR